jgi:hypothetical protein
MFAIDPVTATASVGASVENPGGSARLGACRPGLRLHGQGLHARRARPRDLGLRLRPGFRDRELEVERLVACVCADRKFPSNGVESRQLSREPIRAGGQREAVGAIRVGGRCGLRRLVREDDERHTRQRDRAADSAA